MADAFRDRAMAATRIVRGRENELRRRIAALYKNCAERMGSLIGKYGEDSLTGRRADALRKSMLRYNRQLWQGVQELAVDAVQQGAELGVMAQASVLDDALHGIGLTTAPSFAGVFGRTQDEAVASVLNGTIYSGKRAALSKRIWNNEKLQAGNIEQIISAAVAEGRSATQLARDLSAYVNPSAQMPDHWNDIYPCPFPYRVDYNAKRLAVTALNHAYYQGAIMAARDNPFAEFLHWELSSGHEIYDVCDTYMEHDEGLGLGNFSLDNAPLPHPFCQCTWYIDSSKSLNEIGDEIARWIGGESHPGLDRSFAEWKEILLDAAAQNWQKYMVDMPKPGSGMVVPDAEVVHQVQNTIDKIVADFPVLGQHLQKLIFEPESGVGAAYTDGTMIRFDNKAFSSMKSLQKLFDETIASGHTVNASNPMFIVAHECGHVLESISVLKQMGTTRLHSPLDRAIFDQHVKDQWSNYYLNMGFSDESFDEICDIIEHEMGKRAMRTPSEMLAQAVATCYFGEAAHPHSNVLLEYLKTQINGG